MNFIRKKLIKGKEYYYFEFRFNVINKYFTFSKYIGVGLPANLKEYSANNFKLIAKVAVENLNNRIKKEFEPKTVTKIEESRFWYQSIHSKLFGHDVNLFKSLFATLFLLNSNKSEGSQITRRDFEKYITRKKKPRTLVEIEVVNSLNALRFAFSDKMQWNLKSIKIIHHLLFNEVSPLIAGKFKTENVVINNEETTDPKLVTKELSELLKWFLENKNKIYPPLLAIQFHYKFEAIHPFIDGNGRVGRLLFNAYLIQKGYMPVIFFTENHKKYSSAISDARQGRLKKLNLYFVEQVVKTRKAVDHYKSEEILTGGSPQVGKWIIEKGKFKRS